MLRSSGAKPRRVPPSLRQRAAVSCDFCKKRRRKCVPSNSAGICKLCRENKKDCVSTIPRKLRNYLPGEGLPQRYELMEGMIRRLFPTLDTGDSEELTKMSEYLHQNDVEVKFNTAVSQQAGDAKGNSSTDTTRKPVQETAPPSKPTPLCHTSARYERILKNPSGTLSYFGPSSSMSFVMKLRELLALKAGQDSSSGSSLPPKHRRLRDEFTTDHCSCTMERELSSKDTGKYEADSPDLRPTEPQDSKDRRLIPSYLQELFDRPQNPAEILPPQHELEALVELFFTRVHPNILLFHRPSFQAALEDLITRQTNESSKPVDVGWITCIYLVIIFGCEWQISILHDTPEAVRLNQLKRKLLLVALGKVSQLMLSATLRSVQAFTLLSIYLNCANERNASWVMVGCAIRMAISLGLHRQGSLILQEELRLSPIERELRKRVWWSLYIFEQYCSSLFGRPSAVMEEEISADLPVESILDEGYYRPPGLLYQDVSLARIICKINPSQKDQWLCLRDGTHGLPDIAMAQKLLGELENWQKNLPLFLKFNEDNQDHIYPSHLRQILSLQLRYLHAKLTLARPFHMKNLQFILSSPPRKFENPFSNEAISLLSKVCVNAAFDSWRIISTLWEKGQFDGNLWFDGIFAYQCALVLSLTLLDTRGRSNIQERNELENIIQSILDILHKAPLNKTMNRLVQVTTDFASIVRAMEPALVLQSKPPPPLDNNQLMAQQEGPTETECSQPGISGPAGIDSSVVDTTDLMNLDFESSPSSWPPPSSSSRHLVEDNNTGAATADYLDTDCSLASWDFGGADFVGSLLDEDSEFHAFGEL